ncbi:MAG: hypothetical protein AB7V55_05410, partial [Oscillospiraceae bacterium]
QNRRRTCVHRKLMTAQRVVTRFLVDSGVGFGYNITSYRGEHEKKRRKAAFSSYLPTVGPGFLAKWTRGGRAGAACRPQKREQDGKQRIAALHRGRKNRLFKAVL